MSSISDTSVQSQPGHVPVLLAEVLAALHPAQGETHVDLTFGAGGYTKAILDTENCNVIAFDRDPDAPKVKSTWVSP